MEHRQMDYVDLSKELDEAGYPFARYDEVMEKVAARHGLLDGHGETTRPFSASLVAEVYHRLGPPPRPIGRPSIGPEVKTRLTKEEIAQLDRQAEAAGIDRAELIRRIIRRHLNAQAVS